MMNFAERLLNQIDREYELADQAGSPTRHLDHDEKAAAHLRRDRAGIRGLNSYHASVAVTTETGDERHNAKFRRLTAEQRAEVDRRRQVYDALFPQAMPRIPQAVFVEVEPADAQLSNGTIIRYDSYLDYLPGNQRRP